MADKTIRRKVEAIKRQKLAAKKDLVTGKPLTPSMVATLREQLVRATEKDRSLERTRDFPVTGL